MRVIRRRADVAAMWSMAVHEATAAFGRPECFVERYVERARHVEVQLLADTHGAVVVAGDRDCTVQRRHQKLVEEAPAPFLTAEQRRELHDTASRLGQTAGYVGAGTVEFLLDGDGRLFFLEVNCRLQVEHPVTEEVAGIDLVRAQLAIAAGGPVPGIDVSTARGHAIEFRLTAEDPAQDFAPSSGVLTRFELPSGPGVRVDAGVRAGNVVGDQFDSLLAKVIITGADREQALARAHRALGEVVVEGVATSLPFLRALVDDEAFTADRGERFGIDTGWVETATAGPFGDALRALAPGPAATVAVSVGGRMMDVAVPGLASAAPSTQAAAGAQRAGTRSAAAPTDAVVIPMQSTVVAVHVADGDVVDAGAHVAVVEAMKMQHLLTAPAAGRVTGLTATVGASVASGAVLCRIVQIE
ncbi:MAG: ATP-grasp domain-containing protein [Acidimicrobiia bacterium]|nr:ATP-grasp domain-containing protein [Acidimicrobiia bacterium]